MVRLRAVGESSCLEIKSLTVSLMSFLVGERKIFVDSLAQNIVSASCRPASCLKRLVRQTATTAPTLSAGLMTISLRFRSVLSAAHSSPVRLEYLTDVLTRMSWRHFLTKRSTEANWPAGGVQLDFRHDSSCRVDQIYLFCVQFGSELVRFLQKVCCQCRPM